MSETDVLEIINKVYCGEYIYDILPLSQVREFNKILRANQWLADKYSHALKIEDMRYEYETRLKKNT